ncbi:MAG: hypothetical protein QXU98_04190 [Candidatus Parvarchaeota archaeon]
MSNRAVLPNELTQPQGAMGILQVSIPASQGVGVLPQSNVLFYPFGFNKGYYSQTPSTEVWRIKNIRVSSAQTTDFYIGLVVNSVDQPMNVDVNSVVAGTNGVVDPIDPYIDIPSNMLFNFTAYLPVANGSTAQTTNVNIYYERIPLALYMATNGYPQGVNTSISTPATKSFSIRSLFGLS